MNNDGFHYNLKTVFIFFNGYLHQASLITYNVGLVVIWDYSTHYNLQGLCLVFAAKEHVGNLGIHD